VPCAAASQKVSPSRLFPTGVCRREPVRRPVVSGSAKARGARPWSSRYRHSRLPGRSIAVTIRYFRDRTPLFYPASRAGEVYAC
jgi:hypothetical protein